MPAVLRIMFEAKEQKFIWVKGDNVDDFKPKYVCGSGWTCRIRSDSSIDCKSSEIRNGKYYEIHYCIQKNGKVTITRQKDGDRYKTFSCRIGKWPVDGMVLLTGGNSEERMAFFKIKKK